MDDDSTPAGRLSLLQRFALAGGAVLTASAVAVGTWVSARIEEGVVANAAISAALYMESFLAPVAKELGTGEGLTPIARTALDEALEQTALGQRVVSYKIWRKGAVVEHSSNPALIGRAFEPSADLREAWSGTVSASFEQPGEGEDAESAAERALGLPLMEIYSPVRAPWSGEIIAVVEFYEIATELAEEIARAQRTSWLVVALTYAACGLALFGIVRAGSRTIERQQAELGRQLAETEDLAAQNAGLRRRAIGAAARATEQAERQLRRVSADLHDGPGQNLSLAMLRLDKVVPPGAGEEARIIRSALDAAIGEIRAISRGLSLPALEGASLQEVARRAVERLAGGEEVDLRFAGATAQQVPQSVRIAVYRFLQEAVSNALRHAPGARVRVSGQLEPDGAVCLVVADDGPGFDPETAIRARPDGGDGLPGLRDRIESLGGRLDIETAPGRGTILTLRLPAAGTED